MMMHTTHFLNFDIVSALLGGTGRNTKSCPYCHGKLPDCDCGYGHLSLDHDVSIPASGKDGAAGKA